MLTTTNRTDYDYGDKAIYGRGVLDLGKAVRGPGEFGAEGFAPVFRADTQGLDSQFSNNIRGTGGLVKAGAGSLILSGHNTYTGATRIEGGRLAVNGDTSLSRFTVEAGGTLGGTGKVGSTEVYGRLAPGNSIGTLTVVGDYTQHAGSVLEIEVDAAGGSDRVDVQGNAHLHGGTVQLIGLTGAVVGQEYTFLSVGGAIDGPGFAGVHDGFVFADLRLVSTGKGIRLAVERNPTTFAQLGRTDNQRGAARAIEALGAGARPYELLIGLQAPHEAPDLYDQLSGELHATARSMVAEDVGMARSAVMGRLWSGAWGRADSFTPHNTRSNGLWGHAMSAWGRYDGAGVAQDTRRFGSGFMLGRDVEGASGLQAGVALGYTRSQVRAERHNEAALDGYHLLAYGAVTQGPWRLRAGMGQSWFTVDTRREIDAAGLGRQTARYGAWATQMFTEVGHMLPVGEAVVEPYLGVTQIWQGGRDFKEDGQAPLTGHASHDSLTHTTLGARGYWQIDTPGGDLRLMAGAGWVHALGGLSPHVRLAYQGGGGQDYALSGVPRARNALQIELKASLAHTPVASLELGYLGQIGGGVQNHGLRLQASYRF
ncbi:autotransporter domain-containing protein [Alcaligenaceae bacterium CGII-47]|nr:autotransporter domain-containing protein [Alcaligenaceae bacterium CGII-47]